MSLYNSATEREHASCLPPEAYIRIWESSKQYSEPRFMSSVYPNKKIVDAKKKTTK